MDSKRLLIVDGFSLLYRAFFGTRFLSTSDGRPTNALFGFVSMVFALIEKQRPHAIVVAMDAPGKTFRHAEYAEYKGTRREMPEEMKVQIPMAHDLIHVLGFPHLMVTGFEADDIVGTISKLAEENGYLTTIVTGDLDALQLVDGAVTVMTPKVGVSDVAMYDVAAVRERYGFGPEHVVDYKALVGDSSDNIPGVPGVGEKTATLLIQRYGGIDALLENLSGLEEKYRKKIEPNVEQLHKSKWLATIDRAAPVSFDFAPYRITADQLENAKRMLESLEFKNHLKKLPAIMAPYLEGGDADAPIVEVRSESLSPNVLEPAKDLDALAAWVAGKPYAMVLVPAQAQQSMFDEAATDAFLAVGGDVRRARHADALALFRKSSRQALVYDSKPLYTDGSLEPPRFDAMLAGYVLQSDRSSYPLRDLIQGYLDLSPPETPEQTALGLAMLEAPMRAKIEKEGQTKVLDEIELPLVPVLAEMERTGILLSPDYLREFSKSLEVTIEQTARRVYEMAGQEFLIASPKQLGEVLFDKLNIPSRKKTKTGYATGAEVLQDLAGEYPICGEVLAWRELTKLKSTYADSLPKMVKDDGRIHTSFNQTVAATGRLSSNEPNLQNIPIRTELGRQIRKAFVAAPGFRLASFDYSQIELRLLAHLCRDDALVDAFQKRMDVHAATAALMFGLEPDQVDKEQRRRAKMLNFAVLYGVTDYGLSNQLGAGFSVSEARALIQQYFERFPKVKRFTESVVEEARAKGFTTTLAGRRRYFPEIHASNRNERLYAERQAVNAPIQGAAADMIKIAMLNVRKQLGSSATRMLLQVHDELVFEMRHGEEPLVEPIRQTMESAMPLDVPVEVDAKFGENWSEMTAASL